MTARQAHLLCFIRDYIAKHSYSPSYEEMAVAVGLSVTSKGQVQAMLKRMSAEGTITFRPNVARSVRVVRRSPEQIADRILLDIEAFVVLPRKMDAALRMRLLAVLREEE